jgi:hypothetical protein
MRTVIVSVSLGICILSNIVNPAHTWAASNPNHASVIKTAKLKQKIQFRKAVIEFMQAIDQQSDLSLVGDAHALNKMLMHLWISEAFAEDRDQLMHGSPCFFGGYLSVWIQNSGEKGFCTHPQNISVKNNKIYYQNKPFSAEHDFGETSLAYLRDNPYPSKSVCTKNEFSCSRQLFPLLDQKNVCAPKNDLKNLTQNCAMSYDKKEASAKPKEDELCDAVEGVKSLIEDFCKKTTKVSSYTSACKTFDSSIAAMNKTIEKQQNTASLEYETASKTKAKQDRSAFLESKGIYSCKNMQTPAMAGMQDILGEKRASADDLIGVFNGSSSIITKSKNSPVVKMEATELSCPGALKMRTLVGRKGIKYTYQEAETDGYSSNVLSLDKNKITDYCSVSGLNAEDQAEVKKRNAEIQSGLSYLSGKNPKTVSMITLKTKVDGLDESCFYSDKFLATDMYNQILSVAKSNPDDLPKVNTEPAPVVLGN